LQLAWVVEIQFGFCNSIPFRLAMLEDKEVVVSDKEMGADKIYRGLAVRKGSHALDFVFLGSIIICRLYKLTIFRPRPENRSVLAPGPKKFYTGA
jgi:hypothetical protein